MSSKDKICNGCLNSYPPDDFYTYKKKGRLYSIWMCKECYKAYKQDYYLRVRKPILIKRGVLA